MENQSKQTEVNPSQRMESMPRLPLYIYCLLPFVAGLLAQLPFRSWGFLYRTPASAFFLGLALWLQLMIDTMIWDNDKKNRPYLKAFSEAQLVGCTSLFGMQLFHTGLHQVWISIGITAIYALVRLYLLRCELISIILHFVMFAVVSYFLFAASALYAMVYEALT